MSFSNSQFGPKFEFAFEVRLTFPEVYVLPNIPTGGNRSAVLVKGGTFEGPNIRGRAVPGSGGDYAYFRPDDTCVFDARYLLEEDDGTHILLRNSGYLWGRKPDTMTRLRAWAFEDGPPVHQEEYYLRCTPAFDVSVGKHDWLAKNVFVGIGERREDGNLIRYYKVT